MIIALVNYAKTKVIFIFLHGVNNKIFRILVSKISDTIRQLFISY